MHPMTERRLVRWILFSVPFLCALQWLVVRKIGEPYPAVMAPGFAGDAKPLLAIKTPTLVINKADGSTRETSAYDLFLDLPQSQNVTLVDRGLTWTRTLPPDAAEWTWQRVLTIEPAATGAVVRWTRETPLTKEPAAWLGELTIR